jgi:hypothetical protein
MSIYDSEAVKRGVCQVSTAVGGHSGKPGVSESCHDGMPEIFGSLKAFWEHSPENAAAIRPCICALLNLDFAKNGILYSVDDNGIVCKETVRGSNCVEAIVNAFLDASK